MKRFKMPSQRELRAMYPPQNAEFDEAIRTTIRMLPEGEREETQVKKKLSMSLAIAILMILALTCAAVAVSMGVFGRMAGQTKDKGYAQLYQTLDEKSVEVGTVQTVAKNDDGQKVTFKLAQAYVDGNSLFLSYEASGMQSSVDYSWTPTEEERERMQRRDTILDADTGNEIFDELMQTWKTEGTDADAVIISRKNSFGVYQAGTDEYWNPQFSDERITADGTAIGIKVFELPEEALELEILPIEFDVFEERAYYSFEAGHAYEYRGEQKDYGRVRIDVPLRQNETQADYRTEKTLNTVQVSADVAVTDATIRTVVRLKSLDGHVFSEESENWKAGDLAELNLHMDGEEPTPLSGKSSGMETTEYTEEMVYVKPNPLPTQLEWIPSFYAADNNGRDLEIHPEKAITIELAQ
ncbi:MAG: DUF4179 domain-containing protein [Clostridiales bacterium]|nr:DUF4179 domain-containing protein [Clostridiales bacterium]